MVGKNILVTGGAGYIGSHTVLQLLLGGYNTIVIDNSSLKRVKELAGYHGEYLTFHQVDLRDKPALEKVFSESKFDAVIHFAGQKAVGECVAEPLLYYTNNLIGTTTLLEVMAAHGCKKLVFSSSAILSGSTEESPLSGMSFYGQTQLCIETICRGVQICDPELRIIMLRYFNPVGALSDYTTKDGLDVRDYVQVVDLADGHICALQKLDDTEIGCELYNLRTVKGTTVLEMVDASEKASAMKIPRPGDPIEGDGVSEKSVVSGIQCPNLRIEADDVSEKSEGGALHKLSAYLVKQTELELIYGGRLMRCGRLMRSDYFPAEFTEKVVDILESRVLFLERHGTEVMKEKLLEAKKLISDAKDYLKKAKKKLKEDMKEQEMN